MRIYLQTVRQVTTRLLRRTRAFRRVAFRPKYLLYTNIAISVSLSGLGDIVEQHYEIMTEQLEEYNRQRTRRMCISGMTVGIICHFWYKFLDGRLPGRSLRIVLKKVLIDQIVCSPLYISVFFITLAILEEKNVNQLLQEIKQKAWRLYLAEWVVWPPAQVFNFYFLPTKYRVLYDNTISLGYDVYTSHVKHNIPLEGPDGGNNSA